jgi:threonine/homoserine/homoserine lactone efflux protein
MTFSRIVALFVAMISLAIIPGPGVIAVVARTVASGLIHGIVTVIGIVVGDYIFILLAVFGLSALTETMGSLFVLVKYLGGVYLIWLGIGLWRTKSKTVEVDGIQESSWLSNFQCGLFITLGEPKAIFFYISFLPAFLDLSRISIIDTLIIMISATIVVSGASLTYAYMVDKARLLLKSDRAKKGINIIAGSVMMGTGIFLMAKS